ncbi:hypothetical protein P7C70_g5392, partial [Phenoliferia sp. Uapishka_3]
MRPSTNEAARALASLIAAAFPSAAATTPPNLTSDHCSPASTSGASRSGTASASSTDGLRPNIGASDVMLTQPTTSCLLPPSPSRASTSTYVPLPTRSGRVPRLPNPDPEDADHSTVLFNEYLNYEWPSDDEEDDPDFQPGSEAFGGTDLWVGHATSDGMEMMGDFSNDDEEGETDASVTEDAWMREDTASATYNGDAAMMDPSDYMSDIDVQPFASTSTLPIFPMPPPPTRESPPKGRANTTPPTKSTKSSRSNPFPTTSPVSPRKRLRVGPSLSPPVPSPPPTHSSSTTTNATAEQPSDLAVDVAESKKRGRPRKHYDEDPIEARKQRKRDAALNSRETAKAKAKEEKERLAYLEVENEKLRTRVMELEQEVEAKRREGGRATSSRETDSVLTSSGDESVRPCRPPERRREGSASTDTGESSDGTVTRERKLVLPPGGPPGGLSVEAMAELGRLLAWASGKAAAEAGTRSG